MTNVQLLDIVQEVQVNFVEDDTLRAAEIDLRRVHAPAVSHLYQTEANGGGRPEIRAVWHMLMQPRRTGRRVCHRAERDGGSGLAAERTGGGVAAAAEAAAAEAGAEAGAEAAGGSLVPVAPARL